MKGLLPKIFVIAFCILSAATLLLVSWEHWTLNDAGRLYREGRYDDTLQRYHNILIRYLHRDISSLNTGAALYKKGEYQKALEVFGELLDSPTHSSLALANYNRGNCRYRQGQQLEAENRESAQNFYSEALAYYRTAIELNPGDGEARYNLAVVEKRLLELSERTGTKDSHGENTRGKMAKDAFPKNGGEAQEQESLRQRADKALQKHSNQSVQKEMPLDTRNRLGQLKIKKGTLSREEAEMLLEEFRQREEQDGIPKSKATMGYHREVEKDW